MILFFLEINGKNCQSLTNILLLFDIKNTVLINSRHFCGMPSRQIYLHMPLFFCQRRPAETGLNSCCEMGNTSFHYLIWLQNTKDKTGMISIEEQRAASPFLHSIYLTKHSLKVTTRFMGKSPARLYLTKTNVLPNFIVP